MDVNQGGTGGVDSPGAATSSGVTAADLQSALSDFMPRSEAQQAISTMQADINSKAAKTDLPAPIDLSLYAKKSDIPAPPDLSIYAKKTDVPAAPDLSGYVTATVLQAALATAGISATPMTATLGAGGAAIIKFSDFGKTYATAPVVVPMARFVAKQGFWGIPATPSATQVSVTGKRSKGTLLLSDGPNEDATSGDTVAVLVLGK